MSPTIRPASVADIPALVRVWNAAVGEELPLTERLVLFRTEGDPDFSWQFSRVAEHDGEAVGFVLATRSGGQVPRPGGWGERGWIKLIGVAPRHQRQGLGSALLQEAEAALVASGCSSLAVGTDPYHFMPGPPDKPEAAQPFFARHGYELSGRAYDLMRDVSDFDMPPRVTRLLEERAPRVQILNAGPEHLQAILRFVTREFPGGWHYYSRLYLGNGGESRDFVIVLEGEEVEGFCWTSHYRSSIYLANTTWHLALGERYGGLGPIGVSERLRGQGLGLALLCKAVGYLRDLGVHRMCIDWTGLLDFYGKIGFTPWKRYRHAGKPVG